MAEPKRKVPQSQPSSVAPGAPLEAAAKADRLFVHGRSESGLRVLRNRRGALELAELRELKEGQPLSGEVVSLAATEHAQIFDVETVYEPPSKRTTSGPAQVANKAYREQWESIFGPPKALN